MGGDKLKTYNSDIITDEKVNKYASAIKRHDLENMSKDSLFVFLSDILEDAIDDVIPDEIIARRRMECQNKPMLAFYNIVEGEEDRDEIIHGALDILSRLPRYRLILLENDGGEAMEESMRLFDLGETDYTV